MTLPHERTRAVLRTRDFLRDLLDRKKTPRVPLAVRQRASYLLKHYPDSTDILRISRGDTADIFDGRSVQLWRAAGGMP